MSILSYWRWFAAAALVVLAGYLLQGFGDMRYQAGREAAHAERREAVKLQNAEIKKLEGDLHVTNQKLAAQAKIELAAFSAAAERSRADGLRLREQARQYAAANGRSQNPTAARHAWLVRTLGTGGADFVERGVSSMLPLDVSARLGMGNLE